MRYFSVLALLILPLSVSAAWYLDRDNTMIPAEPEVGDAMAVILGGRGTVTQAIQVCSGVYLATAHGALDDPIESKKLNRPYRPPGQFAMRLIAYPMERENMTQALDAEDYISPRIENDDLWNKNHTEYQNTDYVFISVDEPKRPENFVRPMLVEPQDLLFGKLRGYPIFMYRGQSRFSILDGELVETTDPENTAELKTIFQTPLKVRDACKVRDQAQYGDDVFSHNCPSEQGASGSIYIVWINELPFVVAHNRFGTDYVFYTDLGWFGSFASTSSAFCADYERACGQPCATIDEVLGE